MNQLGQQEARFLQALPREAAGPDFTAARYCSHRMPFQKDQHACLRLHGHKLDLDTFAAPRLARTVRALSFLAGTPCGLGVS